MRKTRTEYRTSGQRDGLRLVFCDVVKVPGCAVPGDITHGKGPCTWEVAVGTVQELFGIIVVRHFIQNPLCQDNVIEIERIGLISLEQPIGLC